MKKISIVIALIFTFLSLKSLALIGEIGINPFWSDLVGRPLGIGGGFSGASDDPSAILFNPGGLAWAKGIEASIKDIENLTVIQAYPTGFGSSFGLAVINSNITNIPISGGTASSNSSLIALSYGTKLSFLPALYEKNEAFQRIGVGLSIKALLGETFKRTGQTDRNASGYDVDLGVLWKGGPWWSAGATLQNILPAKMLGGGEVVWDVGDPEGIPAVLRLGGAAKVIGDIDSPVFMEGRELSIFGELDVSKSKPALARLGGEWGFNKNFFLRSGLMQQWAQTGVSTNLNFGAGYRNGEWGVDASTYRDPITAQNLFCLSVLYFPKDWIVIKNLAFDKPAIALEDALTKISLEDNISTYNDSIDVLGKVKDGVAVYINGGQAALDEKNNFKTAVPLAMGKNLIVVDARYEGENKTWKYKVLRRARIQLAEDMNKGRIISDGKSKVEDLVTLGVIDVSSEAEFALNVNITRGELAVWIAKAAGIELPKIDKDVFIDVEKTSQIAPYVKAVADQGLMTSFADGTFRPKDEVSKEEGDKIFKKLGYK
ncbi:MAG: S-layer homology domain-containing protein [Candidatus Margulisiibacteriota bacterium]